MGWSPEFKGAYCQFRWHWRRIGHSSLHQEDAMVRLAGIFVFAGLALAGCGLTSAGRQVQESAELLLIDPAAIPEAELLDIDIRPFAPDRESVATRLNAIAAGPDVFGFKTPTVRTLRQAEGHYLSRELANKLQDSGHWGLVRLNPYGMSSADLEVTGAVVTSDGISLRIQVEARDARGKLWLSRRYTQLTPSAAVDGEITGPAFPFADLFNAIANDLAATRARMLGSADIATLRQHSTLKFAEALAPSVYSGYRDEDAVVRLPAQEDPVFQVVQEMRVHNEAFLDAMQMSYDLYVDQIARNYLRFLNQGQQVNLQIQDYMLGDERDDFARSSKTYTVLYERMLAELSQPLEEAVEPVTFEFNGHTAELSGTLENQFRQWQVILLDMYQMETGTPVPSVPTE
jgi:hypothetical protein